MALKELLQQKCEAFKSSRNRTWWSNAQYYADAQKMTLDQYCFMSTEITVDDIRKNGGFTGELYQEIKDACESKLIASNASRQHCGQVTKYWLTKKGYKTLLGGGRSK